MTLDVMANSLVYWAQDLFFAGLLSPGARIFAMTSAGDHIVWPSYGAVSAAKSALESYVRQLAVELAPHRVAVNALRAGVTDTPALRKIPGNEAMIERVSAMHPGRPADDARRRRRRPRRSLRARAPAGSAATSSASTAPKTSRAGDRWSPGSRSARTRSRPGSFGAFEFARRRPGSASSG